MKLERALPESMGVSSRALLNFLKATENHEMHSFMLLKGGKVICERWWKPFAAEYRHELFSLSKSFTSTAIGIAVDEGRLSVDTLLADIFTEEFEALGNKIDDELHRMSVKHLLIMSTGMEYEAWNMSLASENVIIDFLSAHVKDEPGQTFRYSSIATYMQAAVIKRLTGESLVEYLRPRLFEPLGIKVHWALDENTGVHMGGFGLNITTEDIAKFGQLFLQKGKWEGKQLVSAAWVEEATAKQIDNSGPDNERQDWGMGYAYQFWRCQPNGVYRGDGMFGQYCVVVPDMDMVIAANSNADMAKVLELFWAMLEEIRTLPAQGDAAEELCAYDGLTHLDGSEVGENYPALLAEYEKDGEMSISFDVINNECLISIKRHDTNENTIYRFVKGEWTKGAANHMFVMLMSPNEKKNRVITYGLWKARVFEATTWHYETAIRDQHRFSFNEDFSEFSLESRSGAYDAAYKSRGKFSRKAD